MTKIEVRSNISSHALKGAFFVIMADPISVPAGRGKDGAPVDLLNPDFVEKFADLQLPQLDGLGFVDCSTELDRPQGLYNGTSVTELSLDMSLAKIGWTTVAPVFGSGRTLKEIIQARCAVDPLVIGYRVRSFTDYRGKRILLETDYFLNGEIVTTPEHADQVGAHKLAESMRVHERPGILLANIDTWTDFDQHPLLDSRPYSKTRVIATTIGAREIGAVVGVRAIEPTVTVPKA